MQGKRRTLAVHGHTTLHNGIWERGLGLKGGVQGERGGRGGGGLEAGAGKEKVGDLQRQRRCPSQTVYMGLSHFPSSSRTEGALELVVVDVGDGNGGGGDVCVCGCVLRKTSKKN